MKGEKTDEEVKIAVAAYDMFQSAMKLLIARADVSSAENYVEFKMVGLPAPFDRAAIHLIREHGRTPGEIAKHNKTIAVQVIQALVNIANNVTTTEDLADFKREAETTLAYARKQEGRLL